MNKAKTFKVGIAIITMILIVFSTIISGTTSTAANLNDWKNEVYSYAAGYGFNVNGSFEQRWLLYDITQKYKDIYCIKSGDRQNKDYIEVDLYTIGQADKDNLFRSERDYTHFMWMLENIHLYSEGASALDSYNTFIDATNMPYGSNDVIGNKLYGPKGIVSELYSVSRNEQIIKVTQNEMLLQYVIQRKNRNTDLSSMISPKWVNGNNVGEKVPEATNAYVQKIIGKLNNKDNSLDYSANFSSNKSLGYAKQEFVTLEATEDDADWNSGISGKFNIVNKYNSEVKNIKVYVNNAEVTTGYTIKGQSGEDITNDAKNILTNNASQGYKFQIQKEGLTSGDKIKVVIDIDYGYITNAVLLKPATDTSVIDGVTKNNQYMINVSREQKTGTVSSEQEAEVKKFDLALTKEVIDVNGTEYDRFFNIDFVGLQSGKINTSRFIMDKSIVKVQTNNTVKYKITVYNEGQVDGYAEEITDYLPAGLEFVEDNETNRTNGWVATKNADGTTTVKTTKLSKATSEGNILKAFNGAFNEETSKSVELVCKVTVGVDATTPEVKLDNRAEISKYGYYNSEGNFVEANVDGVDIDSIENSVLKDEEGISDSIKDLIEAIEEKINDVMSNDKYYRVEYGDKAKLAYEDDDDIERLTVVADSREFDLALRKWITKVDEISYEDIRSPDEFYKETDVITRGPTLASYLKKLGTLPYNNAKKAVEVKKGSIVTYRIGLFNEGEVAGYAEEITDYLPAGVEFVENNEVNKANGWVATKNADGTTTVTTNKLSKNNGTTFEVEGKQYNSNGIYTVITEFLEKEFGETRVVSFKTIDIVCRVKEDVKEDSYLTNRAEITKYGFINIEGDFIEANKEGLDRDSEQDTIENELGLEEWYGENYDFVNPKDNFPGVQDDDDFETVYVGKEFDLALRKWITNINGEDYDEVRSPNEFYKESKEFPKNVTLATYLKKLGTLPYSNPKKAIVVEDESIVTYRIGIFNEGEREGYAEEITDYLPAGLEFVEDNEINKANGWVATKNADGTTTVKTTILSKDNGKLVDDGFEQSNSNLIVNFLREYIEKEFGGEIYKANRTIDIVCKLSKDVKPGTYLTNRAEITKYGYYVDMNGDEIEETFVECNEVATDRDSVENTIADKLDLTDWYIKTYDEANPKDNYPGVQDDDDFETVQLVEEKIFDLSLRKFITKVNGVELKDSREPKVDLKDLLNGKATTAKYEHSKEPVEVNPKDVVEYTIRVYNEGQKAGYAELIMDDVPSGVEMVAPEYDEAGKPKNTNAKYGWVMYRKCSEGEKVTGNTLVYNDEIYVETKDSKEAVVIVSNYLSSSNKDNLIAALDVEKKVLSSKDIKVEFKVKDAISKDYIIVNYAQITKDLDDKGNEVVDRDSTPNKWEESPRDDDQDIEKIRVRYFDLALYKWVTTAIVTEGGKTVEYASEHTQFDKTSMLNVSIPKQSLDKVSVKFKYQIKVENRSEIPGYAKEIKDHIPAGLKFVEEDNKEFGWKLDKDGVITTDYLKDTILNPGESAEVTVILTWINGENNLGTKVNFAEISEDYNDYGTPDIDSTPDNFTGDVVEDDEDKDVVMLQVRTGSIDTNYIILAVVVVSIIATGAILIKKYV